MGRTTGPRVAVREIDLDEGPIPPVLDVDEFDRVRVYVRWRHRVLGFVEIDNSGRSISASQLRDVVATHLPAPVISARAGTGTDIAWARAVGDFATMLDRRVPGDAEHTGLDDRATVSVVVATLDRPDELRRCLEQLRRQRTRRPFEVVVVDNHPGSGLTKQVLVDFPEVVAVDETRRGLARARNAGIRAALGEIVAMTDDDVTVPADWLEQLVAPFAEPEVMAVTGNVLPLELDTAAQRLFETYGGLGRGFERRRIDATWFRSWRTAVPTWTLGATANAAVRMSVLEDPEVGMLEESLGAGMPAGVGEDTYLFYRILKAGYVLVYEPNAYVWHRHRQTMPALRRQLFDYSAGHVAYHLTTVMKDHDVRALHYLGMRIPQNHLGQLRRRLHGDPYPASLQLVEIAGHLSGPVAWWRSRRRAAQPR